MRRFATTVGEFSLRIPHTHALFRDSFSIVRSSERAHGVYSHSTVSVRKPPRRLVEAASVAARQNDRTALE
jgi:uncharacterized C2H2 Zn-finger protein